MGIMEKEKHRIKDKYVGKIMISHKNCLKIIYIHVDMIKKSLDFIYRMI
jgi:hypothetical protein